MNHDTPPHGGNPNAWWDNSAEQRLNFLNDRLAEVRNSLNEVAKELRTQARVTDSHDGMLSRVGERIKDCERAIEQLPTRLEKLASFDWMQRLETRLNNIEDENKSPFLRKTEYEPFKRIGYCMLGALCVGLVSYVLKLMMK